MLTFQEKNLILTILQTYLFEEIVAVITNGKLNNGNIHFEDVCEASQKLQLAYIELTGFESIQNCLEKKKASSG